jgi:hypothetical protein
MQRSSGRHAKGANLIDLVRYIKNYGKTHELPAMPTNAQSLLTEHIRGTEWYDLEGFQELMNVADKIVIKGDEARAREIGAAGGVTLRGLHNAYAVQGDPLSSVIAMRHAWRAHYDFGVLTAEIPDGKSVLFKLTGYPDVSMVHGVFIASWALAAARFAGSTNATLAVVERPWRGEPALVYQVII